MKKQLFFTLTKNYGVDHRRTGLLSAPQVRPVCVSISLFVTLSVHLDVRMDFCMNVYLSVRIRASFRPPISLSVYHLCQSVYPFFVSTAFRLPVCSLVNLFVCKLDRTHPFISVSCGFSESLDLELFEPPSW